MFHALLLSLAVAPTPATVQVDVKPESVVFRSGDAVITEYRTGGTVQVEKGEGTKSLAKPFFWPLNAPGGIAVTRPWPMKRGTPGETTDHFHQKSAWFCHGDVIAEGLTMKTKSSDKRVRGIDFWAEGAGHGRIVVKDAKANGPSIRVSSEWLSPDGVPVILEDATITVRVLEAGHLIEYDTKLSARDYAVTFGDTKEGSFGIRVPDDFRLNNPKSVGVVTSSDGSSAKAPTKDNLPMWGKPAAWHDYSGDVNGKAAGIALFTDAKNIVSVWHTRAYGLLAANPFGRDKSGFPAVKGNTELVKIAKGDSLALRFAIYTHTGDVKSGQVDEAYKIFAK